MKKDQYIPHEVSMRNTTEVMNLIEKEGMAGYGRRGLSSARDRQRIMGGVWHEVEGLLC